MLYVSSPTYNTDDLGNARYPLDGAKVTEITSDATYTYYSVGPVNKAAADRFLVQYNAPFELDRSRIAVGDTLLPVGQDGKILGYAGGKPEWEDKPVRHIQQFTETFPSFVLVRSDANKVDSAASYFSPTFDLDTTGNAHGEFHLSLELRIAPVSDVNMGFEAGKANQTDADRQRALTSIVFASDLAEEDAFSIVTSDTRDNGIQAFSITVYSGATIAGHYRLSVVHNANNEVGVWTWYEGEAGATGFTVYAELRVSFTPSDTQASGLSQGEKDNLVAFSGAFDGGEWENYTGNANTIPSVSSILRTTPFTTYAQANAGTWSALQGTVLATMNAYIIARVPADGFPELSRLRLQIGTGDSASVVQLDSAPASRFRPGDVPNDNFRYFQIGPIDKPATSGWRVQQFKRFVPDKDRLRVPLPLGFIDVQNGKTEDITFVSRGSGNTGTKTFENTVDLDDYPYGVLYSEITLRFEFRSRDTVGFGTDNDDEYVVKHTVFASALRNLESAQTHRVVTVDLYDGSLKIGLLWINYRKNADNEIVYSGSYSRDPGHVSNGTGSVNSISVDFDVVFLPQGDVAAQIVDNAPSATKPYAVLGSDVTIARADLDLNQRLPAPEAGKIVEWNSGATALMNVDKPPDAGLTFTEIASVTTTGSLSSNTAPSFNAFSSTEQAAILAAKQDASVLAFYVVVTRGGQFHKTAMVWKPPGATGVNTYLSGIMGNLAIPANASYGVVYFTAAAAMSIIRSDANFYWRRGDTLKVYKVT